MNLTSLDQTFFIAIMAPWFEYESGHAWCESAYKYQTLTFVAEFAK
jgi:hypothetical protein